MSFQRLFGKEKSLDEKVKEWKHEVRSQSREIDKQIRNIESQEGKVKLEIKAAARRPGTIGVIRTLALELVRSGRVKDRLLTGKTQLNSITMQLQEQLSMIRVSGTVHKSTQIMSMMNSLIKLPELHQSMAELSKEMMKAGLIGEMMEESIGVSDDIEEEEAVSEEVDKVIQQLTEGVLSQANKVPSQTVRDKSALTGKNLEDEEAEKRLKEMRAKLQALK